MGFGCAACVVCGVLCVARELGKIWGVGTIGLGKDADDVENLSDEEVGLCQQVATNRVSSTSNPDDSSWLAGATKTVLKLHTLSINSHI